MRQVVGERVDAAHHREAADLAATAAVGVDDAPQRQPPGAVGHDDLSHLHRLAAAADHDDHPLRRLEQLAPPDGAPLDHPGGRQQNGVGGTEQDEERPRDELEPEQEVAGRQQHHPERDRAQHAHHLAPQREDGAHARPLPGEEHHPQRQHRHEER